MSAQQISSNQSQYHQIISEEASLSFTFSPSTLKIVAICLYEDRACKFTSIIKDPVSLYNQHQCMHLFKLFNNCQEIFNFAKAGGIGWKSVQNLSQSTSNLSIRGKVNGIIIWSWSITKDSFTKQVSFQYPMQQENLNQLQQLKFQNMLLKKKLQQCMTKKSLQDSTNLQLKQALNIFNSFQIVTKQEDPDSSQSRKLNVNGVSLNSLQPFQVASSQETEQREQISGKIQSMPRKQNKQIRKQNIMKQIIKKKKQTQMLNQLVQEPKKKQAIEPSNSQVIKKKRGRRKKNIIQQFSTVNAQKLQKQEMKKAACDPKNMIKISFENGDYYYGQIKNNLYHGHGLYFSLTNGTFQGQWQNGKANGYGTSKDPEGNKHSGYYINDKRNGKGVDIYTNGQKYSGNFEQDCKSGYGKYLYANGDSYEGHWKNDMYDGKGKEYYNDGSNYEGFWSADQKDGQGIFTTQQGKRYKQMWSKGVKISQIEAK